MGSRQGLREEGEFRPCSAWPEAKILLLIKLSRASLSAQAPREGARAAGLPPLPQRPRLLQVPARGGFAGVLQGIKGFWVPAWPLQGNKSLWCAGQPGHAERLNLYGEVSGSCLMEGLRGLGWDWGEQG